MIKNCNFKTYNGKTLIRNYMSCACYSDFAHGKLDEACTDIICYQPLDNPFTQEELKTWCDLMTSWGFKADYLGMGSKEYGDIPEKYVVIRVYVKDAEKQYIKSKTMVLTTLTIVRYLFEDNILIARKYFELAEELPKANTFYLMQMAHHDYRGTNFHTLRNSNEPRMFITLEEVHRRIAANPEDVHKDEDHCRVFEAWKTDSIGADYDSSAEIYKACCSKKDQRTKVYVVGTAYEYINWFPNSKRVKTMKSADVVVFTGGEDVTPSLYDEPASPHTCNNPARDVFEKKEYERATKLGLKKIGICRGSQFLCVMAGGKLVQHQAGQPYIHEIKLHTGAKIKITSTHHQAAYPHKMPIGHARVLGWSEGISKYHLDGAGKELVIPDGREAEIVHYPKAQALGIQGHPEYMDYQADNQDSLLVLQTMFTKFIKNKL